MTVKKRIPSLSLQDKGEALKPETSRDIGIKEERELSKGLSAAEIRAKERSSKYERNERLRRNFDNLIIIGLWAAACTVLVVMIVWVANLVLPDKWRWLTPEESGKLQWFVTGVILASTALPRVKKRLD